MPGPPNGIRPTGPAQPYPMFTYAGNHQEHTRCEYCDGVVIGPDDGGLEDFVYPEHLRTWHGVEISAHDHPRGRGWEGLHEKKAAVLVAKGHDREELRKLKVLDPEGFEKLAAEHFKLKPRPGWRPQWTRLPQEHEAHLAAVQAHRDKFAAGS